MFVFEISTNIEIIFSCLSTSFCFQCSNSHSHRSFLFPLLLLLELVLFPSVDVVVAAVGDVVAVAVAVAAVAVAVAAAVVAAVVVIIVVVHVAVFVTYTIQYTLPILCCCSLFSFVQKFSAALGWLHKFLNNQPTDTTYGKRKNRCGKGSWGMPKLVSWTGL